MQPKAACRSHTGEKRSHARSILKSLRRKPVLNKEVQILILENFNYIKLSWWILLLKNIFQQTSSSSNSLSTDLILIWLHPMDSLTPFTDDCPLPNAASPVLHATTPRYPLCYLLVARVFNTALWGFDQCWADQTEKSGWAFSQFIFSQAHTRCFLSRMSLVTYSHGFKIHLSLSWLELSTATNLRYPNYFLWEKAKSNYFFQFHVARSCGTLPGSFCNDFGRLEPHLMEYVSN